jgi:hypothetical protein
MQLSLKLRGAEDLIELAYWLKASSNDISLT